MYTVGEYIVISIHAPAKGATESRCRSSGSGCDFNPRSREGSDRTFWRGQSVLSISIHAPAKGATRNRHSSRTRYTDFNPRSREGSDFLRFKPEISCIISIHAPAKGATCHSLSLVISTLFQSTLPRRERQYDAGN